MSIASELGEYTQNIKGNIAGGLTAGVVALPLCLAFGIASGLGAARFSAEPKPRFPVRQAL